MIGQLCPAKVKTLNPRIDWPTNVLPKSKFWS